MAPCLVERRFIGLVIFSSMDGLSTLSHYTEFCVVIVVDSSSWKDIINNSLRQRPKSTCQTKYNTCFSSTFPCFLRHVWSRLRHRWHSSLNPSPVNTFPVCIHEHTVNLRRSHWSLPPWLLLWKLPYLAARMLELTERCKGYNCMAAVHRISPILQ